MRMNLYGARYEPVSQNPAQPAPQQQNFFMRMRNCCSRSLEQFRCGVARAADLSWMVACAGVWPSLLAYSSGKVFSVYEAPPWVAPSGLFLLTAACPLGFYAAYTLKIDDDREIPHRTRILIALYATSIFAGFTFGFHPECRMQLEKPTRN